VCGGADRPQAGHEAHGTLHSVDAAQSTGSLIASDEQFMQGHAVLDDISYTTCEDLCLTCHTRVSTNNTADMTTICHVALSVVYGISSALARKPHTCTGPRAVSLLSSRWIRCCRSARLYLPTFSHLGTLLPAAVGCWAAGAPPPPDAAARCCTASRSCLLPLSAASFVPRCGGSPCSIRSSSRSKGAD